MKRTDKIVNLVTGNLDIKDKKQVLSEIQSDEESKKTFFKIKTAWALISSMKKRPEHETEKAWLALQNRIQGKIFLFNSTTTTILQYAAILGILISLPVIYYLYKQTSSTVTGQALKYTSVIADNGQISKIILPDSSLVWLNSSSTLSYNNGYAISNRDLILKGHAYMNIMQNNLNPLVVACNDLKIKVTGTKFDISAYPEDDNIQVVLESGNVHLLRSHDDSFRYRLNPGEMVQYDKKYNKISVKKVNTADFICWKEGYLIFNDDPMAAVIERLQRKFNIEITVKNKEVYKSIFTANFKDEGLNEILDYIAYSCPIKYTTHKETNESKKQIDFFYESK